VCAGVSGCAGCGCECAAASCYVPDLGMQYVHCDMHVRGWVWAGSRLVSSRSDQNPGSDGMLSGN